MSKTVSLPPGFLMTTTPDEGEHGAKQNTKQNIPLTKNLRNNMVKYTKLNAKYHKIQQINRQEKSNEG